MPAGEGYELRSKVEEVTGGPAKIVWARDTGKSRDVFATGTQLILMGLDTRSGSSEMVLCAQPDNYSRPLLTPDGREVIFSRRRVTTGEGPAAQWDSTIHVVGWDGAPPRLLRPGYAVEVWQDPGSGKVWVYALTELRPGVGSNPEGTRLFRFPLDGSGKPEVLWRQGLINSDNIQLNRSGNTASGLIPWPNAGTFDLTAKRFIRYRNGCWPSLSPDDSGVVWVFDGTHKNLRMFLPGVEGNWRVPMEESPELQGKAAYHPRWSNDPRVLVFTGPHPVKLQEGDGPVSVILARFDERLQGFEKSVGLPNGTGHPDCYPDVWVQGGEQRNLDPKLLGSKKMREQAERPAVAAADWSPNPESLCFTWARATSANTVPGPPTRECSVGAVRMARFGRRFEMLTQGGAFVVDDASTAAILAALRQDVWSLEMGITPLEPVHGLPRVIFRAGAELEIQQSGADLIFHTPEKNWQLGAGLTPGQTLHLVVGRSGPGESISAMLNGQAQELQEVDAERQLLPPASSREVQFGSRLDGSAPWSGLVEAVAVHGTPPAAGKMATHAAWWREQILASPQVPQTRVLARLEEASPRATLESIRPYLRSWTSARYRRLEVRSGPDPGETFCVAHWTILGGSPVPGSPGTPGSEVELLLEPMAAHPEMDSENGSEEVLQDGETLFLDCRPAGS